MEKTAVFTAKTCLEQQKWQTIVNKSVTLAINASVSTRPHSLDNVLQEVTEETIIKLKDFWGQSGRDYGKYPVTSQ